MDFYQKNIKKSPFHRIWMINVFIVTLADYNTICQHKPVQFSTPITAQEQRLNWVFRSIATGIDHTVGMCDLPLSAVQLTAIARSANRYYLFGEPPTALRKSNNESHKTGKWQRLLFLTYTLIMYKYLLLFISFNTFVLQ